MHHQSLAATRPNCLLTPTGKHGSDTLGMENPDGSRDLRPCVFPCLDSTSALDGDWQSVEIPSRDALGLENLCKHHGVSSLAVMQTAWALLLRCYVGSNSSLFGQLILTGDSLSKDVGYSWAPSSYLATCKIELEEAESITRTLQATQTNSSQVRLHQQA